MKNKVKKVLKEIIYFLKKKNRAIGITIAYKKEIKTFSKNIKKKNIYSDFEKEHIKKWKNLYPKASSIWFRVYSEYIGRPDVNIIPDNIFHIIVEPILNNYQQNILAEEKNYYSQIYSKFNQPLTLIRNINGIYTDKNYSMIYNIDEFIEKLKIKNDKIIIKPSIDSGSGKNVDVFKLSGNNYMNKRGDYLNLQYLNNFYDKDFIIQEFLKQSPMLSKYNLDSINTLRILTYRSVVNNEVYILHSVLRVGKKGVYVDNAHAGGTFCAVDEDGRLLNKIYDDKGKIYYHFNGHNITNDDVIPNYDKVLNFSKHIAENTFHARLLSLDIMIDEFDMPKLIEINTMGQGVMFFQMTKGAMFGEFTDEIINYCIKNYK